MNRRKFFGLALCAPAAPLCARSPSSEPTLQLAPTYNIEPRGLDGEKLTAMLAPLLAASADRAKQDLIDAFRRNGLPAPRKA